LLFNENTLVFLDKGQWDTLLSLVLSTTILLGPLTSVVLNDASAQKVVYANKHNFTCLVVVGFVMYCSVDSFHKVSSTLNLRDYACKSGVASVLRYSSEETLGIR
jgi:hypothetical protein